MEEKITKSKVELERIESLTIKEMTAYVELKELQDAYRAVAKDLDTEEVSEENHDAKVVDVSNQSFKFVYLAKS